MSRVEVKTDWELIAKQIGAAMSQRMRRKAVNTAGASARKDLIPMLAEVYSTSRAGLGARAKAAVPGSEDPVYTLRMNRQIRLGKLKSGARRFEKRRNARLRYLKVTQSQRSGAKGIDVFRTSKGDQRGEFALPASRGRKARKVGGPVLRRALDTNPQLRARRDQIVEDLAAAVSEGIEAALKKRRR